MTARRQIIAMGGGGFSMEPDNPLLDDYVLRATGKEKPRVCFIGTASGDAVGYLEKFHAAFAGKAETTQLKFFNRTERDLKSFVMRQDVIYVGGGSTANMLAIWKLHGLDAVLKEAWQAGVVMAGISAGALCWFQAGTTDSFGGIDPMQCLGFLPGSFSPHYDGEAVRRPMFQRMIQTGRLPAGHSADDGAALHFVDDQPPVCIASRPEARCYRVELRDRMADETVLPTRYLGK